MVNPTPSEFDAVAEKSKQKREKKFAIVLGLLFLGSTLVQAIITEKKRDFGFIQSLLYFGLIHLNVILIMFLVFLISRNLIKAYLLRKSGRLGSSLRWKLVTSLLAFSVIPSLLLFVGSSFVIRQGFERWFGGQVSKSLEDAQAITEVHYSGIEKNLFHFGEIAKGEMSTKYNQGLFSDVEMQKYFERYSVDSLEIYPGILEPPLRKMSSKVDEFAVPRAAYESLERAFSGEEFLLIRQFGDGDLVQRFVSFTKSKNLESGEKAVVVLTQIVPLGLKTRIADLKTSFTGYQNTLKFKDSLKGQYTLVLLTLFVLVLFVVSWFGLLIARGITEPVAELLRATEAFRDGQWSYRIPTNKAPSLMGGRSAGVSNDLEALQLAFNTMAEEVGFRGKRLEEANAQLISLVRELEERERYLEILLSAIRRGVLVLDTQKRITRINAEAFELSPLYTGKVGPDFQIPYLGLTWEKVFSNLGDFADINHWLEESFTKGGLPNDRVFEVQTEVRNQQAIKSVRATGIALRDENRKPLGWLIILEDISDASRLEKLAAWQEVARRVAHEIKNPLTPIQISADRMYRKIDNLAQLDSDLGEIFSECLSQIQKQVRVIRDLVKEFSQFAKLPEPKFESVELVSFLKELMSDYSFHHTSVKFFVESQLGEEKVWVKADPEYMRRLFVNLADNSLHAMESASGLTPKIEIKIGRSKSSEDFYRIEFRDNGPGVSSAIRDRIFDPYVTSRASGLGLGLPIVRKIAMEHSGRVRCEESENGALFSLELPCLKMSSEEYSRV